MRQSIVHKENIIYKHSESPLSTKWRGDIGVRIAVYPGSFDPVTNGHLDIIERAAKLFDLVYVAVICNPEKKAFFSVKDRMEMLKQSLQGKTPQLIVGYASKVVVDSFDGLLVRYVEEKKASVIIRGLRAVSDFDYEFQMALTNRKMDARIETVFLMTDYKYSYLSSSLVKQVAKRGGDVSGLVPKIVTAKLALSKRGK